MSLTSIYRQTALIIETNNLKGGEGGKTILLKSLQRLLTLMQAQTVPLQQLGEIIITHDGLEAKDISSFNQLFDFVLRFVRIPENSGYYQAKNIGFSAISANIEYVVFADSDCQPVTSWLYELLSPFHENSELQAVAGRTSYKDTLFGTGLTTIDFYYYPHPEKAGMVRNFYANNIALKRALFSHYIYQDLSRTYRGHCQRSGLKMDTEGVLIQFARKAHTVHRLPDTFLEILKLRWMRGQDTCSLTPFLVKRHLPKWMQWFAKTGPIAPLLVLFIRLGVSLKALNCQDLPKIKGLKWMGAATVILAVSAIDMAGAFCRGMGLYTSKHQDRDQVSLSYHE